MSTTAGLGSGDYVAINGTAILAILLGVGSAIVLLNSWLLLVVPLLGVICAMLAFVQISHSNGTQTGKAVAAIGLLFSLGFGGFFGSKSLYFLIHNKADEQEIIGIIHTFGDEIKASHYSAAYDLLDSRMKSRVSLEVFQGVGVHVTSSPLLGNLQSMDWNHLLSPDTDPVTGEETANGMMLIFYSNSPTVPVRVGTSFRKVDGKWYIDQIPQFFPEQPATPSPQQSRKYAPLGPAKPN
jgi:hypothetical protein